MIPICPYCTESVTYVSERVLPIYPVYTMAFQPLGEGKSFGKRVLAGCVASASTRFPISFSSVNAGMMGHKVVSE